MDSEPLALEDCTDEELLKLKMFFEPRINTMKASIKPFHMNMFECFIFDPKLVHKLEPDELEEWCLCAFKYTFMSLTLDHIEQLQLERQLNG